MWENHYPEERVTYYAKTSVVLHDAVNVACTVVHKFISLLIKSFFDVGFFFLFLFFWLFKPHLAVHKKN